MTKHSHSQAKTKSPTISSEPTKTKRGSRKDSLARPNAPKQAARQESIAASGAQRQAPRKEHLSTLIAQKKAPHNDPASRSVGRFTIGLDLGDRSNPFCVLDDDGAVVAEGKVKTTRATLDQQFANLAPEAADSTSSPSCRPFALLPSALSASRLGLRVRCGSSERWVLPACLPLRSSSASQAMGWPAPPSVARKLRPRRSMKRSAVDRAIQ